MTDTLARMRQIVGSSAAWASHDLVLGDGEIALERREDGTVRARVGDGSAQFSASPYLDLGVDVMRYKGNADPTAAPPASPLAGDAYTASPGGVVAPGWGAPVAGETVAEGDLLIFDDDGQWNIQTGAIDTSAFVTHDELGGTDDDEGAAIVAFLPAGANAVPSDLRRKGRERVSLMDFVPQAIWADIEDGTNALDLALYIRRALATGRDIYCEGGLVFLTSGAPIATPNVVTAGQRLWGGGTFRNDGTAQPMFVLQEELADIAFDGVRFDGNRAAHTPPIDVPAIKGWLLPSLFIRDCAFFDIIDAAIKIADSAKVDVQGSSFRNIWQNGIELRNYVNDPRIPGGSTPYTGTRPLFEGGHRIAACLFDLIDNGLHGGDDGCGVTMDSHNALYPILGATVTGCQFLDIKRAVSSENHAVGAELRGFSIVGNVFNGNIRGASVETYVAVGLIGVKGATVEGNTFRNTGNFTPGAGANSASIVVSGAVATDQSSDIVIKGNTFVDDTAGSSRTQYHVQLKAGRRIKVVDNIMSGASIAQIALTPADLAQVEVRGNLGAEGAYSWGDTAAIEFEGQNLAANTTTQLRPFGFPDDNELIAEAPLRVVGVSVRLTAVLSAGSLVVKVFADGVEETDLRRTITSSPAIATDAAQIALEQAVTIAANKRVRVDVTTDAAFAPAGSMDIQVIVTRDLGMKV